MTVPAQHPFSFDPTYGMGMDQLLAMRAPDGPADFDDAWRARYGAALGVDPQPRLADSAARHPDWLVYDVSYASAGGFPIRGWLMLPRDGVVRRGLVVGHGYGGRDGPDFDVPVSDTAVLFPCLRGLSRSARAPISTEPQWHVLHDIDKPDRYILGGCVQDVWVAVSVLTRLYPWLDGRIGYSGISFGGGIGALAIGYDRRIDRGHLVVPTFGNVPVWLRLPTTGSGSSVQAYAKGHPEVAVTMARYDAAVAAARIRVPMLVAAALFDPAVAPPCQFSIANALAGNDHETFVLDAGHFDYPGMTGQHAALAGKVRQFFRAT